VAALRAGARIHPLAGLLLENVGPILRRAALGVDRLEHVLEDRFLVAEELPVPAIELPENPRLADREDELLIAEIDEHALEDFVQVQRLSRGVLVMPRERAVLGVERNRRARVQHVVEVRGASARAHPRLRLRDAQYVRSRSGS